MIAHLSAFLSVALALLFVQAALHKFRAGPRFQAQLAAYRLLPNGLVPAAAWLLALIECLTILLLLVSVTRAIGAVLAATLMLLYTGAIVANLLRGRREIDCGCGDTPVPLSLGLVGRNGVVILAAVVLAGAAAPAEVPGLLASALLGLALLATCILWAALEQLLANVRFEKRERSEEGEIA